MEDLTCDRIWDKSFKKVQNTISRKNAEAIATKIFPSANDIAPTCGVQIHQGMTIDQKVKRIQALANSDSAASAWINANPAHYLLRMSDPTFINAWKMRNLKELVSPDLWCRCGKQKIDLFAQHLYVCSAKKIYNTVRGNLHRDLKWSITRITEDLLLDRSYATANMEPKMRYFFKVLNESATPSHTPSTDESFGHTMSNERRADICARCMDHNKNLIVDVTTASPLAKKVISNSNYKPGLAADEAVKTKVRSYKKYFNINDTKHSSLWFFAIDTNGCLSREARGYCKLLANLSNNPGALQYIYQRVSVAFQNSLAEQVFKAIHHYTSENQDPIPPPIDPEPEIS